MGQPTSWYDARSEFHLNLIPSFIAEIADKGLFTYYVSCHRGESNNDHHITIKAQNTNHMLYFWKSGDSRIVIFSNGLLDPIIEVGDLSVDTRLSRPAWQDCYRVCWLWLIKTSSCCSEEFLKTCSNWTIRLAGQSRFATLLPGTNGSGQ